MQPEAQAALEQFAPVAREFCEFIDNATTMHRQVFLAVPIKLARICEAGASLPATHLVSQDAEDEDEIAFDVESAVDPSRYSQIVTAIRTILVKLMSIGSFSIPW